MNGSSYSGTDNLELMAEAINYNRFLVDLISDQVSAGINIVDFGAGLGTFAAALKDRGLRVRCVEPDRKQAESIAELGYEVYYSLAELKDGSVDVVYSLNVLEHIEDDTGALGTLAKKLRPGGRLLLYVPAFQILFSSMDRKVCWASR